MARIRKALATLADLLGANQTLLARAQRRYKANRKRAYTAHNQGIRGDRTSDRLRAAGHPEIADKRAKEAARAHVRAFRNHTRAHFWLGRIKALTQRLEGIQTREDKLNKELVKLAEVRISGNRAEGGTPGKRWKAVCLAAARNCSSGRRRNFYSQAGGWDCVHEIEPGPAYGERSDCSQFVTGMAYSAGLPDPNGASFTGGYTGTLYGAHNGWKQVSKLAMMSKGWGYIVYGGYPGHHTEAYIGGNRTIGHGSAPVDAGVIDLFGDGDYSCFIYDPH